MRQCWVHSTETAIKIYFTVLPLLKHVFFKIVLILQVQLMSTEQTKARAKGKWQMAQVLNQNFCFWVFSNYLKSSGLSVWSMYSQLFTVWVLGIFCSMEMLKSSLCVYRKVLEWLPWSQPRWGLQQLDHSHDMSLNIVTPCHRLWGVTAVGSPGYRESPWHVNKWTCTPCAESPGTWVSQPWASLWITSAAWTR